MDSSPTMQEKSDVTAATQSLRGSDARDGAPSSLQPSPEHDAVEQSEDAPPAPKSLRFKLTILFLCFVSFLGTLDSVIVAACLPAIAVDLNSSSVDTFWVGTAFLLGQTVTIPIFGVASEVFGRKWSIITALCIFLFGSIMCSAAQNIAWLIGSRTAQGIGAGGILQLVQVIVSDITTMRERGKYMALVALAWAFGTIAGVPLGGAIGSYTTWRWIFYINIPVCVICIAGLVSSLSLQTDTSSYAAKLGRIDWLGLSIFTAATTLSLFGVTSGGVSNPWTSATTLAPLILGALLYPTFVIVQWKLAKNPMMPLRIFQDRTAITGFSTSFLQGLILWCYVYYLIIFFVGARQHRLLHSSAETLSAGAFVAPSGIVASVLIKKYLRFKYIIVAGWVLMAVGMGANVTMHAGSSNAMVYGPRCLAGIGAGLLFPTPLFAVQAKQHSDDVGIATSVQVFFRSLGMTFGVAMGGTIFTNRWQEIVENKVSIGSIPQQNYIPNNEAELAYQVILGFPKAVQDEYRSVYADSLTTVWWVMTALALLGLAVSLAARNEIVDGGLSGNQNFVDKKKINKEDISDDHSED